MSIYSNFFVTEKPAFAAKEQPESSTGNFHSDSLYAPHRWIVAPFHSLARIVSRARFSTSVSDKSGFHRPSAAGARRGRSRHCGSSESAILPLGVFGFGSLRGFLDACTVGPASTVPQRIVAIGSGALVISQARSTPIGLRNSEMEFSGGGACVSLGRFCVGANSLEPNVAISSEPASTSGRDWNAWKIAQYWTAACRSITSPLPRGRGPDRSGHPQSGE